MMTEMQQKTLLDDRLEQLLRTVSEIPAKPEDVALRRNYNALPDELVKLSNGRK